MKVYGIIVRDKLVVVAPGYPGAKPVVYEDVPLFDQEREYVIQLPPVDVGTHIFMGIEVKELPLEEGEIEHH